MAKRGRKPKRIERRGRPKGKQVLFGSKYRYYFVCALMFDVLGKANFTKATDIVLSIFSPSLERKSETNFQIQGEFDESVDTDYLPKFSMADGRKLKVADYRRTMLRLNADGKTEGFNESETVWLMESIEFLSCLWFGAEMPVELSAKGISQSDYETTLKLELWKRGWHEKSAPQIFTSEEQNYFINLTRHDGSWRTFKSQNSPNIPLYT